MSAPDIDHHYDFLRNVINKSLGQFRANELHEEGALAKVFPDTAATRARLKAVRAEYAYVERNALFAVETVVQQEKLCRETRDNEGLIRAHKGLTYAIDDLEQAKLKLKELRKEIAGIEEQRVDPKELDKVRQQTTNVSMYEDLLTYRLKSLKYGIATLLSAAQRIDMMHIECRLSQSAINDLLAALDSEDPSPGPQPATPLSTAYTAPHIQCQSAAPKFEDHLSQSAVNALLVAPDAVDLFPDPEPVATVYGYASSIVETMGPALMSQTACAAESCAPRPAPPAASSQERVSAFPPLDFFSSNPDQLATKFTAMNLSRAPSPRRQRQELRLSRLHSNFSASASTSHQTSPFPQPTAAPRPPEALAPSGVRDLTPVIKALSAEFARVPVTISKRAVRKDDLCEQQRLHELADVKSEKPIPGRSPYSSFEPSPEPSPPPGSTSSSDASAAGSRPHSRKRRHQRHHSDQILANSSKTYAAYERLEEAVRQNKLEYFPPFDDIKLLVNIEEGFQLTQAKYNILAKLRNMMPQAGRESWERLIQDISLLGVAPPSADRNNQMKETVNSALNVKPGNFPAAVMSLIADYAVDKEIVTKTVTGPSGAGYELLDYTGALPVHFTPPKYANTILEHIQDAGGDQEAVLANPLYVMNTMPKLCASLMQSGKTESYYSASPEKWDGVGLVVDIADFETLVHAHNKDSYSPTFFKAPGVEAHTQKDSLQAVDFFKSFWMRFSVFRTFAEAIYQNTTKVYNLDPIRRPLIALAGELQSTYGIASMALQEVIKAPSYTAESVRAAISKVKEQLVALTQDRVIDDVKPGTKVKSAQQMKEVMASAPKTRIASKYRPAQFVELLCRAFPEVLPASSQHSFEQAFGAIDIALQKQIEAAAAPKPALVENKSALLENLGQAISIVEFMKLEKGCSYERWIFQQIFQRAPEAEQNTLDELKMINEFLSKLCAENLPKLRKAGDKAPDMTIFGRMEEPAELIEKTRVGEHNELNILTATAKEVGLRVPSFNGLVIQEYMCPGGVVSAIVEAAIKKAKSLDMPIFYMRAPK